MLNLDQTKFKSDPNLHHNWIYLIYSGSLLVFAIVEEAFILVHHHHPFNAVSTINIMALAISASAGIVAAWAVLGSDMTSTALVVGARAVVESASASCAIDVVTAWAVIGTATASTAPIDGALAVVASASASWPGCSCVC